MGAAVGTACVYVDMEGPMRLPRWKAGITSLDQVSLERVGVSQSWRAAWVREW